MLRALVLLFAVLSAGLPYGSADARSRDRDRDPAVQDEGREPREARRDRRDGSADAARRAQMRNGGGRVLSVESVGGGYRVKVLKDGVVRIYYIEEH